MKNRLMVIVLVALSLAVGVLFSVTAPFIALAALGADAPPFTPYVAATFVALVVIGHAYMIFRIRRTRSS